MVTALMFETMSVEVCDALKKAFVTAWVGGAPRRQVPAASRDFKEINGAFIGYNGLIYLGVGFRCASNPGATKSGAGVPPASEGVSPSKPTRARRLSHLRQWGARQSFHFGHFKIVSAQIRARNSS